MDGFKGECKLCDNIISDEHFKVIEEFLKSIGDLLLLKLTLDNDTQNVICATCFPKLLAALNFKSTCLYTDNSIIPFVDFENPAPVDLKEVYKKEKKCEQEGRTLDDQEICRLCLKPMTGDRKSIQEVSVESIQTYIPEINFALTRNPVICIKCHDALCVHSTFIKNFLDVEKRRNLGAIDWDILSTNPSIKTEEIEIKSEDDETHFEILFSPEKEGNEEGDKSLLSQYSLIATGKFGSDVDDLKQTKGSTQSAVPSDKSKERICTSTSESLFTDDKLRYKRDSKIEVNKDDKRTNRKEKRQYSSKSVHESREKCNLTKHSVYKCDKCKFTTKRKGGLVKHFLIHKDLSVVRKFKCDECDYKSIYKGNLKRHQLTHKSPSEVRMFKCDECDFKSIHKHFVNQHSLKHKDLSEVRKFKCDECDYKCNYKSHLTQHQLRHKDPSTVRMFKCDECDYKTKYKGDLLKHQLIHKDPSKVQMHRPCSSALKASIKASLKKILTSSS